MNDPRIHYFEDHVRQMTHQIERGKVHVFFRREAAAFWVKPAAIELLDQLADAVETGEVVSIAWDPATLEIVGVRAPEPAAEA